MANSLVMQKLTHVFDTGMPAFIVLIARDYVLWLSVFVVIGQSLSLFMSFKLRSIPFRGPIMLKYMMGQLQSPFNSFL